MQEVMLNEHILSTGRLSLIYNGPRPTSLRVIYVVKLYSSNRYLKIDTRHIPTIRSIAILYIYYLQRGRRSMNTFLLFLRWVYAARGYDVV